MSKTSVIHSTFKQGNNCKIGEFNVIEEGVVIGNNVKIGHHTIIHKGAKIADNTIIGSFCEIGKNLDCGQDVIIQGRIRTGDNCLIEDNVTIKYGTILTGDVHLKRKCFLGPNVITLGSTHKRVEIHGTVIGENTYIGAGSKIAGGMKITNDVVIGALGFVNKDITEPGVYVGTPIRKLK